MYLIMENFYEQSHPAGLYDNQQEAFTVLRKLNGRPATRDASHNYSLMHIDVNSTCRCYLRPEIFYCSTSRRFFSYFNQLGEPFQFTKYDQYLSRCAFQKKPIVSKKPPVTEA